MKPLIASLVILLAASFALAQATTQGVSGTRYAVRSIHIDPGNYGFSSNEIDSFASNRAGELAPQILHVPGDQIHYSVVWTHMGDDSSTVELTVKLPDPHAPSAAKEFADRWAADTADFVKTYAQRSRDQALAPLARARDEANQRLADAQNRVDQLRKQIRDVAHRADVSVKNINEAVTRLEEERQKLELDQMGKTARRLALEKEIAEQTDRVEHKSENDPIAEELSKVVDGRKAQVERLEKLAASKDASQSEVEEALGRFAEARAKLLERKRDAAIEAGGEAIAGLNRELLTLSIDLRELEARLQYVKQHLPGLLEAMDHVDDLDRAQGDLALARDEYVAADKELRQFNLRSSKPPQLTIANVADGAEVPEENTLFGGGGGGRRSRGQR
jgi:transposase